MFRFGLPLLATLFLSTGIAMAETPAERLAEAIRLPTVSAQDPADFRSEPFLALHALLAERFPLVHGQLELERVSQYSLLFRWPGRDAAAAPILLTSHLDVVPAPEDTLGEWEHAPFSGVIADGFVWGRGTLDDKGGVLATLEAAERLLAEGFVPSRTVYLAFGHDEEIHGHHGAAEITRILGERGVRFAWSLDEGMAVVEDALPGLERPAALVGIAEKGFLNLRIRARGAGGHSSMPPRESAIGRLAKAVGRLEANPMPARLDTVAGRTLDAMAPHLSGVAGFALRWRRLLGPLVERTLAESPQTDAMIRTTTAVTMARAGTKPNVLAGQADAIANFRVLPGDTTAEVEAHVRRVVDDPDIEVALLGPADRREPSAVSSTESEGFAVIAAAIREVHPEAIVAPALTLGGTDSKHYARIADDSYRFAPLRLERADTARIHGVNERVSITNYEASIDFYEAVLRRGASGPRADPSTASETD